MQDDWILSSRVAPFGNLRIKGYLLLTVAYRSLSRPSSAPDAKAFPLLSYLLDQSKTVLSVLSCELCRQFFREIVIVTHLYDVPQLKYASVSFQTQNLSVALLHFVLYCSVFKVHSVVANSASLASSFCRKLAPLCCSSFFIKNLSDF